MTTLEPDARFASLRVVALDAVGTVMEPVPSVGEVYHRIGAKFGSGKTLEEVAGSFKKAFADTESSPEHASEVHQDPWWTSEEEEFRRWKNIVRMVLDDVVSSELCFRELHEHFAHPRAWRIFPDVAPTLDILRQRGLRVVLASNFDDRLHSVCKGSDVLRSLDACFISSELGVRKPSLNFYRRMLECLNVAPHELLMIGDDPRNDILPPQRLNIPALLLDRKKAYHEFDPLDSLEQLPSRIP